MEPEGKEYQRSFGKKDKMSSSFYIAKKSRGLREAD
jgi:hypothetical protein